MERLKSRSTVPTSSSTRREFLSRSGPRRGWDSQGTLLERPFSLTTTSESSPRRSCSHSRARIVGTSASCASGTLLGRRYVSPLLSRPSSSEADQTLLLQPLSFETVAADLEILVDSANGRQEVHAGLSYVEGVGKVCCVSLSSPRSAFPLADLAIPPYSPRLAVQAHEGCHALASLHLQEQPRLDNQLSPGAQRGLRPSYAWRASSPASPHQASGRPEGRHCVPGS